MPHYKTFREAYADNPAHYGVAFVGKDFAIAVAGRATASTLMTIHLFPGKEFYGELGISRGGEGGLQIKQKWGDAGGILGWVNRRIAGEDIRVAKFVNSSPTVITVPVRPENYSGLYTIDLGQEKEGTLYCQKGACILSSVSTEVGFSFFKNLLKPVSWFNKRPYLMEKIKSDDLVVIGCPHSPMQEIFVEAGKTYMAQSEDLYAHTEMKHSLTRTTKGMGSVIGNLLSRYLGLKFLDNKEDILNIRFEGPGKVILYTPPQPR